MTPLQQETTPEDGLAPAAAAAHPAQRFVIRRLRHLIPEHFEPMGWLEAERIAAAQGALVARLAERTGLDIADFIGSLPVVRVVHDPKLPDSRTSYWDELTQQWVIVIRDGHSIVKRRFGILHEFKRILDRGYENRLYDPRYLHGHVQSEMAADHFTSCALLPARRVRAELREGASIHQIARRYRVTVMRACKRLSDLNLLPVIKSPERREP